MPVHDWTRVDAGLFHAFHLGWSCALCDALNSGPLPSNFYAILEGIHKGSIQDDLTSKLKNEELIYARKANRMAVRHNRGNVLAVIEIVSRGSKASQAELRRFVEKIAGLIRQEIHVLVIDLFPPGTHDRQGIHKPIWAEFTDGDFKLPSDKPFTLVSYSAGVDTSAYVDVVAVGDVLPEMPLFLEPERYVPIPLEATYQTAWNAFPNAMKRLLESPPA